MRPCGTVRVALLKLAEAGTVGPFDVWARQAGLPEHQVRQTLNNMRHQGLLHARRPDATGAIYPQRLRAIYAPASNDSPFDALSFASQAWR